jgi:transcription antitermination factor NusG
MATTIEKAEQKVKELEEKLKQAKALKQKAEARVRAAEAKQKRADDTRRKVLLGAYLLQQMNADAAIRASVLKELQGFLTRPDERALFDLAAPASSHAG